MIIPFAKAIFAFPTSVYYGCRAVYMHFTLPRRIAKLVRENPPHCAFCLGYMAAPLILETYGLAHVMKMYGKKVKHPEDMGPRDAGILAFIKDQLESEIAAMENEMDA